MRLGTALALACAAALACGGPRATKPAARPDGLVMEPGLPPLSSIARDGDPAAALAAFVSTQGIEQGTGGASATALAAIVEARLVKAGFDARVVAQWDGVRVDVLFAPEKSAPVVEALAHALFDRVATSDPALDLVRRRLDALARLPWVDETSAACGAELAAGSRKLDEKASESVRAAAAGIGRVGLGSEKCST